MIRSPAGGALTACSCTYTCRKLCTIVNSTTAGLSPVVFGQAVKETLRLGCGGKHMMEGVVMHATDNPEHEEPPPDPAEMGMVMGLRGWLPTPRNLAGLVLPKSLLVHGLDLPHAGCLLGATGLEGTAPHIRAHSDLDSTPRYSTIFLANGTEIPSSPVRALLRCGWDDFRIPASRYGPPALLQAALDISLDISEGSDFLRPTRLAVTVFDPVWSDPSARACSPESTSGTSSSSRHDSDRPQWTGRRDAPGCAPVRE